MKRRFIRRACKLLAGLYPREWRQRYQPEFEQLLEDSNPSFQDAVLILYHAAALRLERTWQSTFGPALLLSGFANVIGLVNASVASASGYALWQSTANATLLALVLILLCGVCGLLAARRTGTISAAAVTGLIVAIAGNLLPIAILYGICGRMEDSALSALNGAPFTESREWFQHWARTLVFIIPMSLTGGCIAATCGAAAYKCWRAIAGWSSTWYARAF